MIFILHFQNVWEHNLPMMCPCPTVIRENGGKTTLSQPQHSPVHGKGTKTLAKHLSLPANRSDQEITHMILYLLEGWQTTVKMTASAISLWHRSQQSRNITNGSFLSCCRGCQQNSTSKPCEKKPASYYCRTGNWTLETLATESLRSSFPPKHSRKGMWEHLVSYSHPALAPQRSLCLLQHAGWIVPHIKMGCITSGPCFY